MKRSCLLALLLLLLSLNSSGQGTTCATATVVVVDGPCAGAATISDITTNAPAASCGTQVREGWYSFTLPAAASVTITGINTSRDLALQLISGTCAGTLTELTCENAVTGAGASTETISGYTLAAGTYFVKVVNVGANNMGLTSLCITSGPPGPANDNCSGATALTVNPDLLCGTTTAGTIAAATASSDANTCTGTDDDDVWYSFVATGPTHNISLLSVAGSTTDLYHAVFTGTCGSLGAPLLCSDPNTSTVSGLTAGITYYIRVYSWTATAGQTTTFNICVGTPPPGPANDDCSGAVALTVNPDNLCGTVTAGTIASATASADANSCFGTDDDDVWYSFVATGTTHYVSLLSVAGSTTDLYHAVFTGACGSLGTAVLCSDPNTSTLTGLTPGTTYYVRVYSWTATTGQTSTFNICIGTPPPPPANDNCSGAIALTVNPDFSCGTVTPGTIQSATASPDANTCTGTDDDDVWYSFVATGTSHSVSLLNVLGSTTDLYHAVFTGACGSLGAPVLCSDPNASTLTGLTAGVTYYVRVYSWTATAGQTTTFNICIGTPPPPPANDNCGGAIALTVNPDFACGTVTPGTIQSATASPDGSTCAGTDDDDVWYSFVATGTSHTVSLLNVVGSTTDLYHAVFTGACGSLGAPVLCSDPNASTLTGLTAGVTYYVRVYSWTATTGQTTTFNICIGTPPPPPANDNCGAAIALTVNPDQLCGTVTPGTIASATASPDASTCGGTDDDDVWFSFVATGPSHEIDLMNVTGSTTDLYHAVFTGACGSLGAPLLCSDPNASTLTGLTAGTTYYVRVYSWTATAGQTTSFNICVGTPPPTGPCGTPMNNDYCSNPAVLTYSPGSSWTSSTSSLFTADLPANVGSIFCGSVENNSWYQFTATATTHTFSFTNITNCTNGWGVQAQVYNVTTNGSLCCTNFASVSNCYNPATTTPGIVTATGLTIGNTYYLMVDGNAGDDCDFTVGDWAASGILPIELISFSAEAAGRYNLLKWVTASEQNNDFFTLERSSDGIMFYKIFEMDGAGNSSGNLNYSGYDRQPIPGINYYRLKQTDLDGKYSYSQIVSVNNKAESFSVSDLHPNPTTGGISFELYSMQQATVQIGITDPAGRTLMELNTLAGEGINAISIDLSGLSEGLYTLKVYDEKSGYTYFSRIVKH